MIDFIKLNVSDLNREELLRHPFLQFTSRVNLTTGELLHNDWAEYYGLRFNIHREKIFLSGSLHKFHNCINGNGKVNYSDFTLMQLEEVVQHLEEAFKIDPKQTRIVNLEFGVNIDTILSPGLLLENNLISYERTKTHSINNDYNGKGRYYQFSKRQYQLKIYDKGKQYNLLSKILRAEVKTTKSRVTTKWKIFTLQDLLCPHNLNKLKQQLLKQYDKLLILDSYVPEADYRLWRSIFNKRCKTTPKRHWNKFLKEMELKGQLALKMSIRAAIDKKWDELLFGGLNLPLDKG
jgi:hypothetical protein